MIFLEQKIKNGICFAYTQSKNMTINASLLAAEILAYSDFVNDKNQYSNEIKSSSIYNATSKS